MKQFFKTINLNKKINYTKKLFREKKILNLNSGKSFKFLKWKQKIKTTESIKLSSIWYLNYIKKNKNLIFQKIKKSKLFD